MAQLDLASILSGIADIQTEMRGDSGKEKQTVEQNQALRLEQVNAAETLIGLSTDQARMEGEQRLETEKRKKATGEAFGTDILKPGNRLAYLANEQAAAVDEAIYNSKRAAAMRDTSLFDSPLSYMLARPFAAENDQAAKNAGERAVLIDKSIDDLNTQTQSTVTTQKALQETFTKEQMANQLQQVALTASQKVMELRLNQNKDQLNDLETLRRIPLKVMELSVTSYNLVRAERDHQDQMVERQENRKLRALQMNEANALAQQRIDISKDANAIRAAKIKTAGEQLAAYNKGATIFNRPQISDPAEFERMVNGPAKEQLTTVMNAGMNQIMDEQSLGAVGKSAEPIIAPDAGSAVMILKSVGGRLPATAARTQEFLGAVSSVVQSKIVNQLDGKGKLTGDMMISGINQTVNDAKANVDEKGKPVAGSKASTGMITRMQQNVEGELNEFGGKVKNIYSAPDAATIATNKPDIVTEPFWKMIVEPALAATGNGMQGRPTAEQMMKQAELAVANKTLSLEEAARGVSAYYKAAVAANIVNEKYHSVGLPNPVGYNTQITTAHGAFGSTRFIPINAIDYDQVKHRLFLATSHPKNFSFSNTGAQ